VHNDLGAGHPHPQRQVLAVLCGHEAARDAGVEPRVVAGGEVGDDRRKRRRRRPGRLGPGRQHLDRDVLHQRVDGDDQVGVVHVKRGRQLARHDRADG